MECRPCPLPRGSAWVSNGRTLKAPVKSRYLRVPKGMTLARHRELFAVRFAHSHSGSQFLPHFPSHWYSDILSPHCGQTRLRIDERMRTFNSPGGASMVTMLKSPGDRARGRNGGRMTEGMPRWFCALCDAPNWLAAESVYASRAAPSLSMEQAFSMPSSIANKSR
jgi:hypothetical protein